MTRPLSESLAGIESRLERVPLLSWHWMALGIVGIAQAVEAIDSLAASFALPVLIKLWMLTKTEAGILISSMYAGQMLGAASFGWLSDRLGRLRLLRWSTAALVALGLIAASAWNYPSFVAFRFLQGIAFGGELLLAAAYIAELAAGSFRGRLVFGLNVIFSAGVILASVIATYVLPTFGWRWVFVIAAVGSLPFFLFGRRLPESPRWLACRGRFTEANGVVEEIERRAISAGKALPDPDAVAFEAAPTGPLSRWRDLFAPEFRVRTLLLWVMVLCVGTIGISLISWLPTFFQLTYHISLKSTLAMSTVTFTAPLLASIFGSVVVDRLPRRYCLLAGFAGVSMAAFAMWRFTGVAPIPVAVALSFSTILFQVFLLFTLYLVMVEFYPTRLRGIGSGAARMWLGVSAIIGPTGAGFVSTHWGVTGTLGALFVTALIGLLAILGLIAAWPGQSSRLLT
jgi:MFS transporter, putative metabolite:H+ symporter